MLFLFKVKNQFCVQYVNFSQLSLWNVFLYLIK
jgi:hypothetical protein